MCKLDITQLQGEDLMWLNFMRTVVTRESSYYFQRILAIAILYRLATIHVLQTTDDRQTTACAIGSTLNTVSQK